MVVWAKSVLAWNLNFKASELIKLNNWHIS